MRGIISGYVARVDRSRSDRTTISLTGLTGDGRDDEHPFVQNVRFEGEDRALVRDITAGQFVLVDAALTYSQWRSPAGEARSGNAAVGFTCTPIEHDGLTTRDGYTCPLYSLNEFTLRVRLVSDAPPVRLAKTKRLCEARVVCTDKRGEAHYYNLTAWHRLAEALSRSKKGDTLLVRVKARKEKWVDEAGEHWRDHIEVLHLVRAPKAGRVTQFAPARRDDLLMAADD